MSLSNSKKKKHNWMAGFIIPPPESPEQRISRERAERCRAYWDKAKGNKP